MRSRNERVKWTFYCQWLPCLVWLYWNTYLLFCHLFLAAMIHWTRQIKEVLSSQDTFEAAENSGPLEEIEFWRSRCADLSGISDQLDKPGVKRIQSILEHSKSSYVAPFLKLSKLIQVSPPVGLSVSPELLV